MYCLLNGLCASMYNLSWTFVYSSTEVTQNYYLCYQSMIICSTKINKFNPNLGDDVVMDDVVPGTLPIKPT